MTHVSDGPRLQQRLHGDRLILAADRWDTELDRPINGKPIAKSGRKVTGLTQTAGPPKYESAQQVSISPCCVWHLPTVIPMQHAKILVADDSGTIRLCLKRALQSAGHEVFLACDGLEAVRVAREVDIDLAILDIQMPEMDGYTACEQILRDGVLPIIFLTRDVAPHLSTLGDQLGAYLPKPADDKTLLKTVRNLLQRVVTQAC